LSGIQKYKKIKKIKTGDAMCLKYLSISCDNR